MGRLLERLPHELPPRRARRHELPRLIQERVVHLAHAPCLDEREERSAIVLRREGELLRLENALVLLRPRNRFELRDQRHARCPAF